MAMHMTDGEKDSSYGEQMKSKGGLIRIWRAFTYSWSGLVEATKHEHAFRQELFLAIPLMIVAVVIPVSVLEKSLLITSLLLVLITELLNSAMESCVDYISLERHPLAKRAKDMGSAAVLFSLFIVALVWGAVLWTKWGHCLFQ
jgi:diacylglycerol kinase (ATP)